MIENFRVDEHEMKNKTATHNGNEEINTYLN